MEHGPLPPHERTWRHPSELAAEEQAVVRAETSPAISRAAALTTGTIGLIVIGVLVIAMTPGKPAQLVAVSATTAPAAAISPGDEAAHGVANEGSISSARGTTAVAHPTDGSISLAALATPIGVGRYALVSTASIGSTETAEFEVTLPSGKVTLGQVVQRSDETVLIMLSEVEPGHRVAEQRPHDREVVKVMAKPPVTIAYADVSTLEVAEGTAVVDAQGNLVGLCTKSGLGRRVRLIAVDGEMTNPGTDGAQQDDRSVGRPASATDDPTTDDPTSDHPTTDDPTTDDPTTDDPTSDHPTSVWAIPESQSSGHPESDSPAGVDSDTMSTEPPGRTYPTSVPGNATSTVPTSTSTATVPTSTVPTSTSTATVPPSTVPTSTSTATVPTSTVPSTTVPSGTAPTSAGTATVPTTTTNTITVATTGG